MFSFSILMGSLYIRNRYNFRVFNRHGVPAGGKQRGYIYPQVPLYESGFHALALGLKICKVREKSNLHALLQAAGVSPLAFSFLSTVHCTPITRVLLQAATVLKWAYFRILDQAVSVAELCSRGVIYLTLVYFYTRSLIFEFL